MSMISKKARPQSAKLAQVQGFLQGFPVTLEAQVSSAVLDLHGA